MSRQASFRFLGELNDFLPPVRKRNEFDHVFEGKPSLKDVIEALGVPHTEVGHIMVNGQMAGFRHSLMDGDRVMVYPSGKESTIRSDDKPGKVHRFVLDVHLGKLARYLRMIGFDTVYEKDFDDHEIVKRGIMEKRIVLTRDLGILKHRELEHGYWIRSQEPVDQLREVVRKYKLVAEIASFKRCMSCNGKITRVTKEAVQGKLKPRTLRFYKDFYRCSECGKVYWQGSHYEKMKGFIEEIKNNHAAG